MTSETLNEIEAEANALAAAGGLAEEALALHCDALALIAEGWHSESGCTATELIRRQCGDAAELVAALHRAAAEMRSLRDILEESGPFSPIAADTAAEQSYAQTSARLSDRPQPSFEAPATPLTAASWTPGAVSLPVPDIGGALVGFIAQAADALSADPVETSLSADPAGPPDEVTGPPHRATDPVTPLPPSPPAFPSVEAAPVPANDPVPQAEPGPPPQPQAEPEPPLLAAERPVPPEALPPAPAAEPLAEPDAVADPRTPCEIAADELPQVGE